MYLRRYALRSIVALAAAIIGMAVVVVMREAAPAGPARMAAHLDEEPVPARSLAATCTGCHGPGEGDGISRVDSLAGMPADFLLDRMKDFRNERQQGTLMHQLAVGYTEEELALIARYFAAQHR